LNVVVVVVVDVVVDLDGDGDVNLVGDVERDRTSLTLRRGRSMDRCQPSALFFWRMFLACSL